MRVIIVMVMQTTLMNQLHVLLKPSIGCHPWQINLIDLLSTVKRTLQVDIT